MNTHSTQWRVAPLAWVPISAAICAETVSNGLRAYGLGTHLDKFTVSMWGSPVSLAGAVLVLAAVAVSLSQARAAWLALMPGPWRQRIVAGLAGVLLIAVSVSAMSSHILEAQRHKAGDETGLRGAHERAQAAYDKAAGELASLKETRSTGEIQAAMAVANVSRQVFRRTAQCTDITRDDSYKACKPILDLRQEMAQAIRKRELESLVPGIKADLDAIKAPEKASESETWIEGVWAWIMGFAVVFIATFGPVIWARIERGETKAVSGDPELAKVTDAELESLRRAFVVGNEAPAPTPPKPRKRKNKRQQKREKVHNWVREYTLENGHPPAFGVVKGRFHLPAATASRWRNEALKAG